MNDSVNRKITAREWLYSGLAWLAVTVFWLITTRGFHPTWTLATVVTIALIGSYAAAAYLNHLVYVPRYWKRRRGFYWSLLVGTMLLFTALALTVIRVSYLKAACAAERNSVGPYPVHHLAVDYGLDIFGMVVHVAGAAVVVACW